MEDVGRLWNRLCHICRVLPYRIRSDDTLEELSDILFPLSDALSTSHLILSDRIVSQQILKTVRTWGDLIAALYALEQRSGLENDL